MNDTKYQAAYSGPHRSGVCICGHFWDDHHLCCVVNEEYYAQTGERYVACECEFFGCNEFSGLDAEGNPHCGQYRDSLAPEKGAS